MEKKKQAKARVIVHLEIDVQSTWGSTCTISQVYKQAKDDASDKVRKMIATDHKKIRMVGDVHVEAVIAPER